MFSWAKPHLPAKQMDSQTYLNRLATFLAEVVIKKIIKDKERPGV